MFPMIQVEGLTKTYSVALRDHGLISTIRSLFRPTYQQVEAVKGVDFQIRQGEIVGFLGPNGAGKTTTLKMLAGLLYPSSGRISVAGFQPWERKSEFLQKISMVMGNKGQLTWDNTVLDSLYILKEIYRVSMADFKVRLEELTTLLELEHLLMKLPRNLSLGERAKCEILASLIHQPQVLFLDEPTLGLDVSMQIRLREFIKEYNKKYNTTVIVTSHYMEDIQSLCQRVILIHEGSLLYDGELIGLATKIAPFKLINLTVKDAKTGLTVYCPDAIIADLYKIQDQHRSAQMIEISDRRIIFRVERKDILPVITDLITKFPIADLTITDPAIEAVIDQVYREGVIV